MRVDNAKSFPKELETVLALEAAVRHAGLEAPEESAALTPQVVAINGWNRLAVGLHTPVGNYVSPCHPATGA